MRDLKAEPEAIHTIADQVEAESTAIGETLSGFTADTRALAAGWTGAAHDAFAGAAATWHRDMTTRNEMLDALAQAMRTAADAYEQADAAVARIWSL